MNDQAITTTGFGTEQVAAQRETSATAMAERAKAQITARYIMAMQRPRDLDVVRQRLLKECQRPRFAETARFKKPQGKRKDENGNWVQNYIEGPTIRFAEAAIRCMTNIAIEVNVISDDSKRLVLHVAVTDLEANVPYETEITVSKSVERKSLKQGQRTIGERINSYGDRVFLVEATDDEVLTKANALTSKAIRTQGLRHLPGDILEEAMELCLKTTRQRDAQDPNAARRALLDAFFKLGVGADQVALYLGHKPDALDPSELEELRAVYAAVRDGEVTWKSALEAKTGEVPEDEKAAKQATAQQRKTQDILAKRKAEAKKRAEDRKGKSEPKNEPPVERSQEPPPADTGRNPDNPDDY